jgi:hypothetical protein
MHDSEVRQRALRKLERLMNGPLASVRPRLYRALGISGCLAGDARTAEHDAAFRRARVAGVPVEKTTPRIRRELGF